VRTIFDRNLPSLPDIAIQDGCHCRNPTPETRGRTDLANLLPPRHTESHAAPVSASVATSRSQGQCGASSKTMSFSLRPRHSAHTTRRMNQDLPLLLPKRRTRLKDSICTSAGHVSPCTNTTLIVNHCTYTYTLCINTHLEISIATNNTRDDDS
jgi:hypothetical protein